MLENIKGDIFYIDVGANDPVYLNVSYMFYNMGYHGINIEPAKIYFDKLSKQRAEDTNINCAVADKSGFIEVSVNDADWYFKEDFDYFTPEDTIAKDKIPAERLVDICNRYVNPGQDIHFLKIDIDGFEDACLSGMDFEKYRPWIMCIEVSVNDSWLDNLLCKGYAI